MRWVTLAVVAGCTEPVEGEFTTDPELLPPVPFAACAAPAGGFDNTESLYGGIVVELTGPVLTVGAGDPPDACFLDTAVESTRSLDRDQASWFTAADADGTVWTVGHLSPRDVAVDEGDALTATFAYRSGGFSPTIGSLEIRDDLGALLLWIGLGGDLPDLEPPDGVTFARGDVVGEESGDCGSWSSFALDAARDGEQVTLAYGGSRALGDLALWHGGFDQSEEPGSCSDWFVAHVAVAAMPASEPIE